MLRGYRRYIVAAFGLALVGAAQPKDGNSTQAQKPSAEKVAENPEPTLPPLIRTLSTDAPDTNCGPDKYQSNADLCAQWKAADAALSSSLAAWALGALGLLIGGATLFYAGRASHWAKEAATYTKTGAQASLDALEETRKANALQLRPYVFFVGDEPRVPKPFQRGEKIPFAFKNFGSTPALNVQIQINSDVIARPIGDFVVELEPPKGSYGTVAPGALIRDELECDLPLNGIADIASGKVMILRIRISYDIAGGGSDAEDRTWVLTAEGLQTSAMGLLSYAERQRS